MEYLNLAQLTEIARLTEGNPSDMVIGIEQTGDQPFDKEASDLIVDTRPNDDRDTVLVLSEKGYPVE